jgi:hypothetical protein
VILRPHRRKRNQRIMNRRQSTSISRKREPENLAGEGRASLRLKQSILSVHPWLFKPSKPFDFG